MSSLPIPGFLKLALLVLGTGYLGLALFALAFANRLAFPAPPSGYTDSGEILKFTYGPNGESVSMVHLHRPDSRFLVFYQHGNAEDLESILPRLEVLRQAGFSVLAWDYPGYGTSDGKPSEKLINTIAEQIWESLPSRFGFPPEQILLYGRSIGGGPAVWLATRHESAGLILEGTFTSIFRVATHIRLLPWDIYDNLGRIADIRCPVLFLHGTDDHTVPFSHSGRLHQRAPSPKFFAWFDNGRHNDLIENYADTYYSSIRRFAGFLDTRVTPTASR